MNLDGRVAFVTGGSSGIGNAITATLGRSGAAVVVADVRREPKLDDERSVFDALDEAGVDHLFVETDVSDPDAVEEAISETVETFGGLDILVNNAGVFSQYMAHETPIEAWDTMLDVNLRGTFLCCREAIPHLRESDNGKIVNLSSVSGLKGSNNSAAYCASKGGITNLTRQLAVDYAADEINVNAIAPGVIETAQNAHWRATDDEQVRRWEQETPWPRFGKPQDVGDAALFLASDRSDFVTGHILVVDGGRFA
ncbi:MAG: SDR family NAD(P)-dependent oxidoreductase [Halobacteriota archaeon]|uniref:SDR family NAD(P)-dependent oxidoreductase n=1 Tax=Natronomonas sp. TaxID=2184060 RepID=UPI0039755BF2